MLDICLHKLFFATVHLIYSKLKGKRSTENVNSISKETNCGIRVNFERHEGAVDGDHPPRPITITIGTNNGPGGQRDLEIARRRLQDLLLDYVGCDGARGRLVYEVVASCRGPHCPEASTSRAVTAIDPFGDGCIHRSITISPLLRRSDADCLLRSEVVERIREESWCHTTLIGDEFGVPCRLCHPYVFVVGRFWKDVDRAARLVHEEMQKSVRS